MKKIVRIQDVAKAAGVSITTVSRVINRSPTVSQENRIKVEEAIKRLKYRPSKLAQALAKGINETVGLIIPRYEGIFYSFYALELIRGIGTLCDALKLDLLLHVTNGRTFLDLKSIGGVIFADIVGNRKQLEYVLEEDIPCVVINNLVEDLNVNCIAIDNVKGAFEATDYLIKLGHRRIAHITGDLITQAAVQRLEGYQRALEENKLVTRDDYIFKTDYSRPKARESAQKILELKERPTAVFVASDTMALEVMGVFFENGLDVPKDISIIGFDDNPMGLYGQVSLTTVRQPLIKMAEEGVKKLNLIMKGRDKKIEKVSLSPELIIRDSTAPPPK
jgi:LacI family transcriptional regulator